MNVQLSENAYGKSQVRLTKVTRLPDRHELKEISADILLAGQFDACYLTGDNSGVLPTDTIKNTVYALASSHPLESVEAFALHLCDHFMNHKQIPHCTSATVTLRESRWQRIESNGKPHAWAFSSGGDEKRICIVTRSRNAIEVRGGIEDLVVLKTTDSGFVDFIRDPFTTLVDTTDRIFATTIRATWKYAGHHQEWSQVYDRIRTAILETFSSHKSLAVQQTLYAMGEAALSATASISEIELQLPNQHRIAFNLEPLGLKNANEVFVPTTEPFGMITGTVRRS
ncbi:MAG TPA: urate oxidase [Tepidisphaeraceae bacterium]|nr:urate oxidase [Tepidisphaeraceae bacterium]